MKPERRKKIIPPVSVADIPFLDPFAKLSYEEKQRYGMIMVNGDDNYYRLEFARGRGGSAKEETWNRALHMHTCCESKVPWRHKVACPLLK
jgi:hypothetical protein